MDNQNIMFSFPSKLCSSTFFIFNNNKTSIDYWKHKKKNHLVNYEMETLILIPNLKYGTIRIYYGKILFN